MSFGYQGATKHTIRASGSLTLMPTMPVWARWISLVILCSAVFLAGCERTQSVQRGGRGTGLLNVYNPKVVAEQAQLNRVPTPEPVDPPEPDTPSVKDVFKNVQVLTDLNALEFARLMQAIASWVAPVQGCSYCHNPKNLASDEKYTKLVARKMLRMTRQINTEWKSHVVGTGVTCWTCHRGQNVPSGIWFANPTNTTQAANFIGDRAGRSQAGIKENGNTALPSDALSVFLNSDTQIRIQGTKALASENFHSIKQAEWSYSMMMYMTKSLGVNCTYCHNTRAFFNWNESPPQRATAWYGIRMARMINKEYLNMIAPLLPAYRLSALGDGPKVGCETCHKGAYKPLYGASMLGDYPELAGVLVRPTAMAASDAK